MRFYLLNPNAPFRLKSLGVPKTPEALNAQLQRDGYKKIRADERQIEQRAAKVQRLAQQQRAQADRVWQQKRADDQARRLRRGLECGEGPEDSDDDNNRSR